VTSALGHPTELEDSINARPCKQVFGDQPPRIQAICLDVDDTLIDFTTSARRALCSMLGRDDLWPTWQRMTDEHVAKVIAGEMDVDTMRCARTKAFFADIGASVDDDTASELEHRRLEVMNGAWSLFDDVLPCLDWLRAAGLKVAAVTNASGEHQRRKLADLGIARFFDTVVIAGELGCAKPDPLIFHTACVNVEVPYHQALHVGDRLETDAIGAQHAGLHGVWLDRRHAGTAAPGVPVIETLSDLPELLVSEYLTPLVSIRSGVPGQRAPDPISSPR
jgi:putative hydrolase of the HAD superfamily